ncbi:ribonuclease [Aureococcus anophagefferens]|nr:ribonuclease [Aureococcus anophagefferens]
MFVIKKKSAAKSNAEWAAVKSTFMQLGIYFIAVRVMVEVTLEAGRTVGWMKAKALSPTPHTFHSASHELHDGVAEDAGPTLGGVAGGPNLRVMRFREDGGSAAALAKRKPAKRKPDKAVEACFAATKDRQRELHRREPVSGGCRTSLACACGEGFGREARLPPPPGFVAGRVSIIVPTFGPRHHLHHQIYKCFVAQDWADKELLVLDTDRESRFFAHLRDERVLYFRTDAHGEVGKPSLGSKRNTLLANCSGEFAVCFDDDNLYAPQYVSTVLGHMAAAGATMTVLTAAHGYDVSKDELRMHEDLGRGEFYAFRRSTMDCLSFVDTGVGEEAGVVHANATHRIYDDFGLFIHATHGKNLSSLGSSAERKCAISDPIDPQTLPNPQMRAMLAEHRDAFHHAEQPTSGWRPSPSTARRARPSVKLTAEDRAPPS